MASGRVTVDGVVAREPGTTVDPTRQKVCCNGRPVQGESLVYVALHKPPGVVCTAHDPRGRPRAIDLVPSSLGRLFTIGRLDANSEGLILLTNDGEFAQLLAHPRHHVDKTYELWLQQPLAAAELGRWRRGIHDDGERLRVLSIAPLPKGPGGAGYRIVLGEGKNRHLRRMAAASGAKVVRLVRVAVGPLALGGIKRGAWRKLDERERVALLGAAHGQDSALAGRDNRGMHRVRR
jgi:23S rRNA pseudouridine2605 synthase